VTIQEQRAKHLTSTGRVQLDRENIRDEISRMTPKPAKFLQMGGHGAAFFCGRVAGNKNERAKLLPRNPATMRVCGQGNR